MFTVHYSSHCTQTLQYHGSSVTYETPKPEYTWRNKQVYPKFIVYIKMAAVKWKYEGALGGQNMMIQTPWIEYYCRNHIIWIVNEFIIDPCYFKLLNIFFFQTGFQERSFQLRFTTVDASSAIYFQLSYDNAKCTFPVKPLLRYT